MTHTPITIGIIGLGGYAGTIRNEVLADMARPNPSMKLVAACDVDLAPHAAIVEELRGRGIQVVQGADAMLALPMDAAAIPLPIDLHRSMTEKALAAGKAVLCEKPAAGSLADVDGMIAARDRAGRPVVIGFQDIYHPATIALKRRLLAGEIGRVRSASVMACWPRTRTYYSRAAWAGCKQRNGVWVLDSPLNNAAAHYANALLFLLGAAPYESARTVSLEAELYRAQAIENYDTVSVRAKLAGDVPMLVLLTHACQQRLDPVMTIHGEKGTLTLFGAERAEWKIGGRIEVVDRMNPRPHMIQRFAALVRGEADERAVATLEVARAHSTIVWHASQAAEVVDVPAAFVREADAGTPSARSAITGIEDAFTRCAAEQKMLHESGLVPWSVPARRIRSLLNPEP